jgi:hypothetical protein
MGRETALRPAPIGIRTGDDSDPGDREHSDADEPVHL